MTNVNKAVERLNPASAAGNDGKKRGYIDTSTKAAQNDTITITNASEVVDVNLKIIATGAWETATISSNVITLTSATTGPIRGDIIYK